MANNEDEMTGRWEQEKWSLNSNMKKKHKKEREREEKHFSL